MGFAPDSHQRVPPQSQSLEEMPDASSFAKSWNRKYFQQFPVSTRYVIRRQADSTKQACAHTTIQPSALEVFGRFGEGWSSRAITLQRRSLTGERGTQAPASERLAEGAVRHGRGRAYHTSHASETCDLQTKKKSHKTAGFGARSADEAPPVTAQASHPTCSSRALGGRF